MARATLLIAFFMVICTGAVSLTCYSCVGYDGNYQNDENLNNKYCSSKYWDASKVATLISSGLTNPFCIVMTVPAPTSGRKVQVRELLGYETSKGVKTLMRFNGTTVVPANLERSSGDLEGYFCQKDLCNDAEETITGGSLLIALCLTLLTNLF